MLQIGLLIQLLVTTASFSGELLQTEVWFIRINGETFILWEMILKSCTISLVLSTEDILKAWVLFHPVALYLQTWNLINDSEVFWSVWSYE